VDVDLASFPSRHSHQRMSVDEACQSEFKRCASKNSFLAETHNFRYDSPLTICL
jgi:hypothetical protein